MASKTAMAVRSSWGCPDCPAPNMPPKRTGPHKKLCLFSGFCCSGGDAWVTTGGLRPSAPAPSRTLQFSTTNSQLACTHVDACRRMQKHPAGRSARP